PKREHAAYTLRPKIWRLVPEYLRPVEMPALRRRFRSPVPDFHTPVTVKHIPELVASCEIDHTVAPSVAFRGGRLEAERRLESFLREKLNRFAQESNQPSAHATSDLSPYLHFGCLSSLEVALAAGNRSPEFLEQLIVRRELAFNFARYTERPDSLNSVPD